MTKPVVYILDDDKDIVELVADFVSELPAQIKPFTKGRDFLDSFSGVEEGCLVMDIRMPEMTGMDVLEKILDWLPVFPVVFMSAFANVPISVNLMQKGIFDLVEKPFSKGDFIPRVEKALQWSNQVRMVHREASEVWTGMQALTQREREIMDFLLAGMSSREIADRLVISRFTVDHHRAHILDKLKSPSLSGLTSSVARAKTIFESWSPIRKLGVPLA